MFPRDIIGHGADGRRTFCSDEGDAHAQRVPVVHVQKQGGSDQEEKDCSMSGRLKLMGKKRSGCLLLRQKPHFTQVDIP